MTTSATRQLFLRLLAVQPAVTAEELLTDVDWQELHRLSLIHQVFPLVYQGLKPFRELLPEPFERYRALFATNLARNSALARETDRILHTLDQAGIEVCCRRGPQLARAIYGDPGLRVFADIDLFLQEESISPTVALLQQAEYQPELTISPQQWPGLARIANQLALRHQQHGWLIELHWRAFSRHYALALDALDALVAPGARPGGGVEAELLLLLVHGGKHLWRQLKWLVDIDRLLHMADPIDWSRLLGLAHEAGCLRLVRLGLLLCKSISTEPYPPDVEAELADDATAARLAGRIRQNWFTMQCGERRFLAEYCTQLALRERWHDKLQLCWRWPLWPRPEDWLAFPAARDSLPRLVLLRPLRLADKFLRR
ncbi:MAG: nucleotidyltransferase family protein [Desulfuromonadales bacterium]|nr:nucleotidyltransferase family protein [Desulfuromonadales bacterium]